MFLLANNKHHNKIETSTRHTQKISRPDLTVRLKTNETGKATNFVGKKTSSTFMISEDIILRESENPCVHYQKVSPQVQLNVFDLSYTLLNMNYITFYQNRQYFTF